MFYWLSTALSRPKHLQHFTVQLFITAMKIIMFFFPPMLLHCSRKQIGSQKKWRNCLLLQQVPYARSVSGSLSDKSSSSFVATETAARAFVHSLPLYFTRALPSHHFAWGVEKCFFFFFKGKPIEHNSVLNQDSCVIRRVNIWWSKRGVDSHALSHGTDSTDSRDWAWLCKYFRTQQLQPRTYRDRLQTLCSKKVPLKLVVQQPSLAYVGQRKSQSPEPSQQACLP